MIQNNLDPEVAENPDELVVYGGIGKAARNWECFDAILASAARARRRRDAAGPVGQAGRRVPHARRCAARADRQLEPRAEVGDVGALQRARPQGPDDVRPDDRGLVDLHRQPGHRAGHLRDVRRGGPPALRRRLARARWILTAGLGGMGGAQPLAATIAGASLLAIECQQSRIDLRLRTRYLDEQARDLDDALARIARYTAEGDRCRSACSAMPPSCCRRSCDARKRAAEPDLVTDQTSAHDLVNGYLPAGWTRRAVEGRAGRPGADARCAGRGSASCADARARDARLPGDGHPDGRLRQQHPPGREGRRAWRTRSTFPASCRAYIRPLFCEGKGPFRWVALSGDPEDIARPTRR